ncbi:UDP-glucose 4-epimerase GalE [Microcella alkaliphila]|uniref:UDP-glucose 4-epimerase n=1 Tax=Microcella alkaliphila TaxID=279828 RepID=A0A0U5CHS7_9MICO|nr:UDP-glucose 4-epimerase GalE [Microcella alkaliphila]BAU33298.1 UDP-glucose 4-epimerase [Microcella alkaliphila]
MRVLVTGGSGYIGAHVCRLLRDRGDTVVVVDDFVTGIRERVAEFAQLELSLAAPGAAEAVADFAREHGAEAMIHFAGRKQVPESVAQPLMYWNDNVAGLAAVLQACGSAGVERFLFSSSAAVYGDASGHVTEDAPCHPVNPYGASKLAGEWLTADVARATGLRATSLRYFNVAGAGWPELVDTAVLNLVPMVMERLAAGNAPRIFGDDYATVDGTCVRDFIHVLDLAEAHLAALDALAGAPASTHQVFNVGTGTGISVRQVVEGVRARWPHSALDSPPVPAAVVEPRRPGDPAEVVADPSRIAETLGWRATRTLDDILDSVIAARGQ